MKNIEIIGRKHVETPKTMLGLAIFFALLFLGIGGIAIAVVNSFANKDNLVAAIVVITICSVFLAVTSVIICWRKNKIGQAREDTQISYDAKTKIVSLYIRGKGLVELPISDILKVKVRDKSLGSNGKLFYSIQTSYGSLQIKAKIDGQETWIKTYPLEDVAEVATRLEKLIG